MVLLLIYIYNIIKMAIKNLNQPGPVQGDGKVPNSWKQPDAWQHCLEKMLREILIT